VDSPLKDDLLDSGGRESRLLTDIPLQIGCLVGWLVGWLLGWLEFNVPFRCRFRIVGVRYLKDHLPYSVKNCRYLR